MAVYRNIQLSFWTDNKVYDDFTPEDKYFYLYLLTNPQTNICGCYEVSYSQMVNQTGYNKDTINRLFNRFEYVHKIIKYNANTKEVLILNWHKYNWSRSDKMLSGASKVAAHIKDDGFRKYILELIERYKTDTLSIGYPYPMDTSVAVSVSDSVSISISDSASESDLDKKNKENNLDIIKKVIDYLNNKCNTRYRYNTSSTQIRIKARIKDGYTEDDFYTVIDKKAKEWLGTSQEKYLRPETLFGNKFEGYLNQNIIEDKQTGNAYIDTIRNRVDIVDDWVRNCNDQ
jgi:uncharacterized phage protein (TIGR02220 family)